MIFIKKLNLAILFGSSTNEHEISVISGAAIIKNLDKEKYNITPIYMDKENNFYNWLEDINQIKPLKVGILPTNITKILDPFSYLKTFDLVFIMIHGKNGEDGLLSSIFDFLNIKYVGNKTTPSIITMNKVYTKILLEANNIKTSKYLTFTKYNDKYLYLDQEYSYSELMEIINKTLKYPLFIKPSNSGSSLGITKIKDFKDLDNALNIALEIDNQILIEEEIIGHEVECGILEKDNQIIASVIGEVKSASEFYSFDAKYTNAASKTIIPAQIPENISNEVRKTAIKAFKILNCHGYSRCDFFITPKNEIILNEINTIPGFTEISMYPKLFEASNIPYKTLLDTIINEALKEK